MVQYITRFELEGAAMSLLPVGSPALLCIYCLDVSGKSNAMVDTIPCFEFKRFHQLAPDASPTATPVPPLVLAQLPLV